MNTIFHKCAALKGYDFNEIGDLHTSLKLVSKRIGILVKNLLSLDKSNINAACLMSEYGDKVFCAETFSSQKQHVFS